MAKKALLLDRETIDSRPVYVSAYRDKDAPGADKPAALKYISTGLEANKLFVRGIATTAKPAEVQTLFESLPGFVSCRLVTHKSGVSKGLAYVEFDTDVNAAAALQRTDNAVLLGKKVSVAISNPPARRPGAAGQRPVMSGGNATAIPNQHQKNRLQLGTAGESTTMMAPRALNVVAKPTTTGKPTTANQTKNVPTSTEQTVSQTKMTNEQFRQQFLLKK